MAIVFEEQKKRNYFLLVLFFVILGIAFFFLSKILIKKTPQNLLQNQTPSFGKETIFSDSVFKEIDSLKGLEILPEIPQFEGDFGKENPFSPQKPKVIQPKVIPKK
jgi:hypothetical protein